VTQSEIARLLDLNRPKSIVSRVVGRHNECGSVEKRPRTERPPVLSPRVKQKSRNAPLQETTNTFNQASATRVSKRTLQRALRAEEYQRKVIRKAIRPRLPNKRNRVAWCCDWFLGQMST